MNALRFVSAKCRPAVTFRNVSAIVLNWHISASPSATCQLLVSVCHCVTVDCPEPFNLSYPLSAGDYCKVNVCSNGGTCVTGAGAPFICICPDGFSGDTCNETAIGGSIIDVSQLKIAN